MSERPLQARTVQAREKFLEAFAKTGTIKAAAELAGLDRRQVHRWLKDDTVFAERLNETKGVLVDHLVGKLWQIANDDAHRQQQLVACFGLLKNLDPAGWQDSLRMNVKSEGGGLHLAVVNLVQELKSDGSRKGTRAGDQAGPERDGRIEGVEARASLPDPGQEPPTGPAPAQ